MLVLARKVGESIVIGDNITIKVVALENGIVKFGIDAPREISIIRSELIEEVKESNKAAVQAYGIDKDDINSLNKLLGKS